MPRRGGWRRLGRRRFRYVDSRGRRIEDEAALERIHGLAIPPAWEDVWISPNAGAKLQATGIDAAGRCQCLYHPDFRAAQERAKFERLLHFAKSLPALRQRRAGTCDWGRTSGSGRARSPSRSSTTRGSASETTGTHAPRAPTASRRSRSGTSRSLATRSRSTSLGRTGGASTASSRATLAREVERLADLENGARLFCYERDGETFNLTSAMLNEYLGEHLGNGFTAKDFRTWGGTLLAAVELARHGPPESESQAKRVVASVMGKVGDKLGNTPAVARASYVSPAVVEHYRAGRTIEDFRAKPGSRVARLRADEVALLRMLRAKAP